MAENHPVGFQWVLEAREKNGAKVIHVDPRFNRTSAMSDYWLPLRAGSDVVFLGALINYVLTTGREFREYVVHYTNAAMFVRDDFRDTEELGGLFSPAETWQYGEGRDETLEHPRCVFQVLKRHFARYTPEMVERACGIPRERFLEVADVFTSASGREKTGAICYAVGWTQHSTGVQTIRAAAILQLLLGNMGRPGGGILALRGHASIQGSTDIPTLFDILPGYLPMPAEADASLDAYVARYRATRGGWQNLDAFIVSLLKAYYGDAATPSNGFGFGWLPRLTGDHSYFGYWTDMADGKLEGLLVMGQNPAVGSANAKMERNALRRLKWLAVRDMVETETAAFWEEDPDAIDTEVFFFPAASFAEKEGTFTNTQRLLQWREKAVDPPGDARSELHFIIDLGRRLKAMVTDGPRDAALRALAWNYADEDAAEILGEIQGNVRDFRDLKNDGSTSCGCWIYSGVLDGGNKANGRDAQGRYGHGWGYAWPLDRRILYNRASADPQGKPWSERKALVWWDDERRAWKGGDVPDGSAPPADEGPFLMHPDGLGWIWVPAGLKDGPLPAHYEPLESIMSNPLYDQQRNPEAITFEERADNPYASSPDDRFPYVLTTYRLTEHHTAGGMTRTLSHLAELQPELFAEISPELAAEAGVANGEFVRISTARASIQARALVTTRMPSLDIAGRRVHQVGLPYHWGPRGLAKGDVVNDLLAISEEPNVRIFESKGLTCNVEKA
jgi:formate dehydrogenase major subunit